MAVVELADTKATGAKANRRPQRERRAPDLLGEIRLPGVRLHHSGDRAAAVLVQQSVRRLPGMRRPRRRAAHRRRPGHPRHATPRLRKGAIAPWAKSSSPYYMQTLDALGKHYRFTLDTKWKDLPKKTQDAILYGSGEDDIKFVYDDGLRGYTTKKPFEGVITNLERRFKETESDWAREDLQKYFTDVPCDACHGARLKPEALCVKIAGQTHRRRSPSCRSKRAGEWFTELPEAAQRASRTRSRVRVLKEIRERLKFLVDVGLDYLTLARASGTLSGGESQRIRLASQIGSGLTGVLYVLDEPSIGLHQRDNARLLETLQAAARPRQHRDRGRARRGRHPHRRPRARHRPRRRHPRRPHHRRRPGRRPDRRAATHGPANISPASSCVPIPERRAAQPRRTLKVVNARGNNLKNITAEIPLGLFTCVTGVSGGGKSTLLIDTLYNAVARKLNGASLGPRPARPHRGARAHRQDHRHRPVADRPHAALQPGDLYRRLHADPRMVRRPARERRRAATSPAASRSTSRAAAARPARATASSRSRCTSCPTSTSPATSARASATTARRSRCCSRASRSPTCST